MIELSPTVLACLRSAGWSENYRFNPKEYARMLTSAGFEVSPAVLEFMERCGNMRFRGKHFYRDGVTEETEFIIHERSAQRAFLNVKEFKEELGGSVCLVGRSRDGEMYLYLDNEGRMHANDDASIYFIGADTNQALENLILGKEPKILLD